MNHSTRVFPALPTQLTSQALVSHAGLSVLSNFLNALDFQRVCEDRFSQFAPATAAHRPGRILGALALSLAAGGEQATDIDQLRAAPDLFGPVASDATVSRFMHRIKEQPEAFSYGFATMTRTTQPCPAGHSEQPSDHRHRCLLSARAFRQGTQCWHV